MLLLLTPAVLLGAWVCCHCDHATSCQPEPSVASLPLPSAWSAQQGAGGPGEGRGGKGRGGGRVWEG